MADWLTRKQRSFNMSMIRASGNRTTEQKLVQLFTSLHVHGWRRNYPLLGRPDFVFTKQRVILFADGCFWHMCPKCFVLPKANRKYWRKKLNRNAERANEVNLLLRRKGWKVVRIWEHQLKTERGRKGIAQRIKSSIRS